MENIFLKNTLGFLNDYADVDSSANADSQLIADLGFNSLTLLEMVNDAEDKFGITIEDDELPAIVTVGDVVDLLKRKNVVFSE